MLDAPVSRSMTTLELGELAIMVVGDESWFERGPAGASRHGIKDHARGRRPSRGIQSRSASEGGRAGHPAGNLHAGRSIQFWAGGDEGYSAPTACDGYPEDPVLIVAWSNHAIEGPGSKRTEIHITRLELRDDAFRVVDAIDTKHPTDDPLPEEFARRGRECGLKFQPS